MALTFASGELVAQRRVFSTHDWTPVVTYFPNPLLNPFDDAWVDVKTPGGMPRFDFTSAPSTQDQRRTYCVGTTFVNTTLDEPYTWTDASGSPLWTVPAASFSDHPASPSGVPGFHVTGLTDRRQVVILQCNRTDRGTDDSGSPDENGVVWQRYFYGLSTQPAPSEEPDYTHATNARAISVWAEETVPNQGDVNTRIAICGESYDQRLPLSQAPNGWVGGLASGYIAVYDGRGTLKWTYHFFADTTPEQPCAVTDLAIHVDAEGRDVVTYCGITKHGDPGVGSALHPKLAFLSPDSGLPAPTTGLSGGATLQAPGEWDGFVGRLVYTPATMSAPASLDQIFHSTVSGPGQDGLFGLAEITSDRFVVVGCTEADTGEEGIPISFAGVPLLTAPFRVGVAFVFDASQTMLPTPGNLILDQSIALGADGGDVTTVARDVAVGFDVAISRPDAQGSIATFEKDAIYIVGSTDDDAFLPTDYPLTPRDPTNGFHWWAQPDPATGGTYAGNVDGFVAVLHDDLGVGLWPQTFVYWGGSGDDGLTGVNGWNEFSEHLSVTGFTSAGPGPNANHDIGVTTYLFDNAFGPGVPAGSAATPSNSGALRRLRDAIVGGVSDDRPTMVGIVNATDDVAGGQATDGDFSTYTLSQPIAGGGVAVANDGRVTTVGRTNPVGGGYPVDGVNARLEDAGKDAVRTDLDMVPQSFDYSTQPATALAGVGRTDGTGWQGLGATYPIADYSGGTTPTCGLAPFGRRVGEALPPVARMLIDYEGQAPAQGVDDAAIVVSRPATTAGSIEVGVLWIGFPQVTPIIDGVEFWGDSATWVLLLDVWPARRAYRMPMAVMPTGGSATVSVQLHCLLNLTAGSGTFGFTPVTHRPGCVSEFVASPALWFSY